MTDTTTATPRAGLSRRAFLGSTAAAGVLGAVAPSVLAPGPRAPR
jgi:hypothetical protein